MLTDTYRRLGVPFTEAFFRNESYLGPDSVVTFRKRSSCPAAARDRSVFYPTIAASILEPLISEYVSYPPVHIPTVPMDWNTSSKNPRGVGAEVARAVRSGWSMGWGPIHDLVRLVEAKGVRVFYVRERTEHLDAFACWIGHTPYIFLNSSVDDNARMRFNLAHELGHIVMHRDVELDSNRDMLEHMAHGFAAEFLMPWEEFRREAPPIPNLDRLAQLKIRWRVSMQAMVKHMHSNGMISSASYSTTFKRFASLGYRRGPEPGWIPPDTSAIHAAFHEAVIEQAMSVATLVESRGLPETILADMIPQQASPSLLEIASLDL